MTQAELFEEFVKNVCPYCKYPCDTHDKGITIIQDPYSYGAKCVDYKKDESKIEGYKVPLTRTAKVQRCVMPKLFGKE